MGGAASLGLHKAKKENKRKQKKNYQAHKYLFYNLFNAHMKQKCWSAVTVSLQPHVTSWSLFV